MTRYRRAFLYGTLACALVDLTLITLIGLRLHWLTWAATPAGKATITGVMFVALATWLAYVAARDARRRRAAREAQEWDANEEWFERIHEQAPVRRITKADMDELDEWERQMRAGMREHADWRQNVMDDVRLEDERLTTTVVPSSAVKSWPQPPSPRYWLGEAKPMAEALTYAGKAAWFGSDMRAGVDVVVDTVLDGIVPVSGGPRHAWGSVRGTDTQRRDPAFTAWEENTGAWPVVQRELVGAGL